MSDTPPGSGEGAQGDPAPCEANSETGGDAGGANQRGVSVRLSFRDKLLQQGTASPSLIEVRLSVGNDSGHVKGNPSAVKEVCTDEENQTPSYAAVLQSRPAHHVNYTAANSQMPGPSDHWQHRDGLDERRPLEVHTWREMPEADTFVTQFRLIVPTSMRGRLFVLGDCDVLGQWGEHLGDTLEMRPGSVPELRVSQPIELPIRGPEVWFKFMLIPEDSLMRKVGKFANHMLSFGMLGTEKEKRGSEVDADKRDSDMEKEKWIFELPKGKHRVLKRRPQNYCFPIRGERTFFTDLPRPDQLRIFMQDIALSVHSLGSLNDALRQLEDLWRYLHWQSGGMQGRVLVDPERAFFSLTAILNDKRLFAQANSEERNVAVRILLAIMSSAIAKELPSMCFYGGWTSSEQYGAGFASGKKKGPEVSMGALCTTMVRLFGAFCQFASRAEVVSALSTWSLTALRQPSSGAFTPRTGISNVLHHSAGVSFEWIRQIDGLEMAAGSLDFVERIPEFRIPGRGLQVHMPVDAPTDQADDLQKREAEFCEAVSDMLTGRAASRLLISGQLREADRDSVRILLGKLLSVVPSLSGLLHVMKGRNVTHAVLRDDVLTGNFSRAFSRCIDYGVPKNGINEVSSLWEALVAAARESACAHSQDSAEDRPQDSGHIVDITANRLAATMHEGLVACLKHMPQRSQDEQDAYCELICSQPIFEEAIKWLTQHLLPGRGSDSSQFVLEVLFPKMLDKAVLTGTLQLDGLCLRWLERSINLYGVRGADSPLYSQMVGGNSSALPKAARACLCVDHLFGTCQALKAAEDGTAAADVRHILVEKCTNELSELNGIAVLALSKLMDGLKSDMVRDSFYRIAQRAARSAADQPCGAPMSAALDAVLSIALGRPVGEYSRVQAVGEGVRLNQGLCRSLVQDMLDELEDGGCLGTDRDPGTMLSVLSGYNFWHVMFTLYNGDDGQEVESHGLLETAKQCISKAAGRVMSRETTLEEVERLLRDRDKFVGLVGRASGREAADDLESNLDACAESIRKMKESDEKLRLFINSFCAPIGAHDVEACNSELEDHRVDISEAPMSVLEGDEHWGSLRWLLQSAACVFPYVHSPVFRQAIIEETTSEAPSQSLQDGGDGSSEQLHVRRPSVSNCRKMIRPILAKYEELWWPLFSTETEATIGHVRRLFSPGHLFDTRAECRLARWRLAPQMDPEILVERLHVFVELQRDDAKHGANLAELLADVATIFGVTATWTDETFEAIEFVRRRRDDDDCPLSEISDAYWLVQKNLEQFLRQSDNNEEMLVQLAGSRDTVEFVKELHGEDVRILCDAVEERTDSFIKDDVIADFIAVKSFISEVLASTEGSDPPLTRCASLVEFLNALSLTFRKHNSDKEPLVCRLKSSNEHSLALKELYATMADREATTRVTVSRAMQMGEFCVEMDRDGELKQDAMLVLLDRQRSYNDLCDLRSQAHLMVNSHLWQTANDSISEEDKKNAAEMQVALQEFIVVVDVLSEIRSRCRRLSELGAFNYQGRRWSFNLQEMRKTSLPGRLQGLKEQLDADLKNWEESLRSARNRFFELSFFRGRTLRKIHESMRAACQQQGNGLSRLFRGQQRRSSRERLGWECLQQMCTVNPHVYELDSLPLPNLSADVRDPSAKLEQVGAWLEAVFKQLESPRKTFFGEGKFVHPEAHVEARELVVAKADGVSMLNVVLAMFSAQGFLPGPGCLLFCRPDTDWEDLELFLHRCFHESNLESRRGLFCLAGADALGFELQVRLAAALRRHLQDARQKWRLAMVCANEASYIMDQFPDNVRRVPSLADEELQMLLNEHFQEYGPQIMVCTSEIPGLGKTEAIRDRHAALAEAGGGEVDGGICVVPISGPIDHTSLVDKLSGHLGAHQHKDARLGLHLDIASVSDADTLNTFLFQLLMTNVAASKTNACYLRPDKYVVYIEVANTLCEELWHGLAFCKSARPVEEGEGSSGSRGGPWFARRHLQWSLDEIKVDQDPYADIQVVCLYLQALDSELLPSMDLVFFGDAASVAPLDAATCRGLLQRHFFNHAKFESFHLLQTFLSTLGRQLKSLTNSVFFQVDNLRYVAGGGDWATRTRPVLVRSLLQAARQFAIDSGSAAFLSQQQQAVLRERPGEERMWQRVQDLVGWESNNHLLVMFNKVDAHSITAVYRDPRAVSGEVREFLGSQRFGRRRRGVDLEDFNGMDHYQLLERLVLITGAPVENLSVDFPYVLTADNFLKMVLIHERIMAQVPVVLVGETGCGKTSLIHFLASVVGVQFEVLNFHAGTTGDRIRDFITRCEAQCQAAGCTMWVFLDEVNTCDELGMVNDLVCHRSIDGRPLLPDVVPIAACNPYRLKNKTLQTAGLRLKRDTAAHVQLVYSVNPLPESMMGFAWDYGELTDEAQHKYLLTMLQYSVGQALIGWEDVVVELLMTSQKFIQQVETPWSVSLRDFRRWIKLFEWFRRHLSSRGEVSRTHRGRSLANMAKRVIGRGRAGPSEASGSRGTYSTRRCIVLALAICYYVRLESSAWRRHYLEQMERIFASHSIAASANSLLAILRDEQEDLVDRMQLPAGTAKNGALLENIFVSVVCILNRIPIFMVGKPGCSKSLSLQLINATLRGPVSKDEFFRTLPRVQFVSFQGSESATSDGIIRVFEKAHRYRDKQGSVLPVVLLDEVGLAEVSPHNPLKVLHSLLEPGESKEVPDVAVVGISNWALDAAKMNRAIILSRPEPDVQDLVDTAEAIIDSIHKEGLSLRMLHDIEGLAEAYHEYISGQKKSDFHGLRDFYSLVKFLAEASRDRSAWGHDDLAIALMRNFGGLPKEETMRVMRRFFIPRLGDVPSEVFGALTVKTLIQCNLQDRHARHLLIVADGDAALDILNDYILDGERVAVMCGSVLPEDSNDDYNLRMLSKIILHMEAGGVLVLKDLDAIYGALYDMLNMNYVQVAGQNRCRVAMGPHSNPLCTVHPTFRCIVLLDPRRVANADPPFLNRFEKQTLNWDEALGHDLKRMVEQVEGWVESISALDGVRPSPNAADMFAGYHRNYVASLVLSKCARDSPDFEATAASQVERCKGALMNLAFIDGAVRSRRSSLAAEKPEEARYWEQLCIERRIASIEEFLQQLKPQNGIAGADNDSRARRLLVLSESRFAKSALRSGALMPLSFFKSERDMSNSIREFYQSTEASAPELMLLSCRSSDDPRVIQLARFLINEHHDEFVRRSAESGTVRHAGILVHVDRRSGRDGAACIKWHLSFSSGWTQNLIENTDGHSELGSLLSSLDVTDLTQLLASGQDGVKIVDVIQRVILWSFLHIRYARGTDVIPHIRRVIQEVAEEQNCRMDHSAPQRAQKSVADCLGDLLIHHLETRTGDQCAHWLVSVASNVTKVVQSGGLLRAARLHMDEMVKGPLAKILFLLEKDCCLRSYYAMNSESRRQWSRLFELHTGRWFDLDGIPDPVRLEQYAVGPQLPLQLPFVLFFYRLVEDQKTYYMGEILSIKEKHLDARGREWDSVVHTVIKRIMSSCEQQFFEMIWSEGNVYEEDFAAWVGIQQFPNGAQSFKRVFATGLRDFKRGISVAKNSIGGENSSMETEVELLGTMNFAPGLAGSPLAAHLFFWEHGNDVCSLTEVVSQCCVLRDNAASSENSACLGDIAKDALLAARPWPFDFSSVESLRGWEESCRVVITHLHNVQNQVTEAHADDLESLVVFHDLVGLVLEASDLGLYTSMVSELQVFLHRVSTSCMAPTRTREGIQATTELLSSWKDTAASLLENPAEGCERPVASCVELEDACSSPTAQASSSFFQAPMDDKDNNRPSHGPPELLTFLDRIDVVQCNFWKSCASSENFEENLLALWSYVLSGSPGHMPALVSIVRRCSRSLSWDASQGEGEASGLAAVLVDELHAGAGNKFPTRGLGEVVEKAGEEGRVMLADALQVCVFDEYVGSCLGQQMGHEQDITGSIYQSLDVALSIASAREGSPLQLVIASSILRSVVDLVGKNALTAQSPRLAVSPQMRSLFSSVAAAEVLQMAFLRRFRSLGLSMADLQSTCEKCYQSGAMPFLSNLRWTAVGERKLAINPMKALRFYDRAETALSRAIQQPGARDEARRFIADASRDADMRQAASAALAILLYIPRGWRRLEDCEKKAAEWLRLRSGALFKGWPREEGEFAVKLATNGFEDPFFALGAESSWGQVQKAVLGCHLTIVCMSRSSPLQMASVVRSQALGAAYLPAMESDEQTTIFNAVAAKGDMVMKYRCSCGHTYTVGNCGGLNAGGKCPDCKRAIGGGTSNERVGKHEVTAPNDVPGYLVEQVDVREKALYRQVRDLTPVAYRVLRLFQHLLFLTGSATGPSGQRRLAELLGMPETNARDFLASHTDGDWGAIRRLLRLPEDDCFTLLHCMVSHLNLALASNRDLGVSKLASSEQRRQWEAQFQALVVDRPSENARRSIDAFLSGVGSFEDRVSLEARIDERDAVDASDSVVALFRSRCPFEVEAVQAQFSGHPHHPRRHPFLALAFESLGPKGLDGVAQVRHLPALLQWHVTVEKHLKYRVGRRQATNATVTDFLLSQGNVATLNGEFERFRVAWNAVRRSVTRFQCTEFPGGIPEMSPTAPLSLCCCERMEPGIYLCAILHHLLDLQNNFLEQCANLLALPEAAHISSRFASANGTWRFPKRKVQLLRPSDFIDVDPAAVHDIMFKSGLATWDLRYGHGRNLLCNFFEIEKALADRLIGGKVMIDADSVEEMSYQMEAFQGCSTTLHDVSQRFLQQPIGPEGLDALTRDLRACQDIWDVKAALEALLCFIKQDGGNQNRTIGEFVGIWFSDATVDGGFVQRTLSGRSFCSLPLSQVVSLYECVEGVVMSSSKWSVHGNYRAELPPDVYDDVLNALRFGDGRTGPSGVEGRIRAPAMVHVLERFAFRFLSSDRDPPWRPKDPAAYYLADPRCITWPPNAFAARGDEDPEDVVVECVPQGLLLGHVGALCELLKPMVWVSFD